MWLRTAPKITPREGIHLSPTNRSARVTGTKLKLPGKAVEAILIKPEQFRKIQSNKGGGFDDRSVNRSIDLLATLSNTRATQVRGRMISQSHDQQARRLVSRFQDCIVSILLGHLLPWTCRPL